MGINERFCSLYNRKIYHLISFSLCVIFFFPVTALSRTITVTDALGRKVVIKTPVKRAVFLIAYEFIPYFDLWDQTVGISIWAKKESELLRKVGRQKLCLFKTVGTATNPNLEAIFALDPDVVITWSYYPEEVKAFSSLNIPVLTISPESLSQLMQTMRLLALVFEKEERYHKVKEAMDHIFTILKEKTSNRRHKLRVGFFWNNITRIAGRSGVVPDLIRLAGGKNIGDRLTQPYVSISLEKLVLWDPEVIFIWGNALYDETTVLHDTRLSSISAVKNSRVYKLPSWSTWSPRAALIALWMAQKMYPDSITKTFFQHEKERFDNLLKVNDESR